MSTDNFSDEGFPSHGPRLCSRCRTVDFDREKAFIYLGVEQFSFHLSDMDPSCQLCRSLETLCKKGAPNNDKFVLMARWGTHSRDFRLLPKRPRTPSTFASLSIRKEGANLDRRIGWLGECPESVSISDETLSLKVVDSGRADFNLIKSWMNGCLSEHGCERSTRMSSTPNLHVIDCHTRKVVPAPSGCDYTALSYVWGRSQTDVQLGDTLGILPKTIEDAIEATRMLGYSFLWVDRYCIRQDNARHRMEQIHSMHKIYSNAKVTIVAAAGDGPDHGLPGVSDRHRREQPQARLGSRLMVSTLSNPPNLIFSSKWWTRGWTYQECMVSKRLLFFTEEQVYFQCKKTAFCESLHCPINVGMAQHSSFGILRDTDIWVCINQYLKRDLTFPSDILNAMFSILQRFQQEMGDGLFKHLWGLPVLMERFHMQNWDEAFSQALLWYLPRPSTRREGFPSWSWTGWSGLHCTHYKRSISVRGMSSRTNDTVQGPCFMVNVADGHQTISLDKYFVDDPDSEHPSPVLQVRANVIKLRFMSGMPEYRVGRNKGSSAYALHCGEEQRPRLEMLKDGQYVEHDMLECTLDKAVEDLERNHLGLFMGFTFYVGRDRDDKVPEVAFFLVVEQKDAFFEKIGVCSAPYDAVLDFIMPTQTIRLG